jgi:hypothetical protein
MNKIIRMTLVMTVGLTGTAMASTPSLRGSPASMVQQNQVAKEHSLTFYRTTAQIHEAVAKGDLVELTGNENYAVADFVRHPYLQPEGLLFVERLSAQYREACGQKLVVTSAVRPSNGQPSNSHRLSVHPAGMAVDLRVSDRASCRSWLESALLGLEARGVLNGIREFHPPHYHVAIFPNQYREYAEARMAEEAEALREAEALLAARQMAEPTEPAPSVASVIEEATGASALVEQGTERTSGAARATLLAILALPFGIGVAMRKRWIR